MAPVYTQFLTGRKTERLMLHGELLHWSFLRLVVPYRLLLWMFEEKLGGTQKATCQKFEASGLAHSLFPGAGQIHFPGYQIKASPFWKKKISWFNFPSTLCLWHSAVSSPACSLGGHSARSLLISACQLGCHAHQAQSHHSASTGWLQEATEPLSSCKP